MSKETVTILVNGAIALVLVVFIGLGRIPLEYGIPMILMLAIPSAAPELAQRLREALAARKPPGHGPGVLALLAVAALATACRPAGDARASSPPCAAEGKTIDACARDYTRDLTACTALSHSLQESLSCEDRVRAHYGQPARETADGGAS